MPYSSTKALAADPKITDEDLGKALRFLVRSMATNSDKYMPIFREAAVLSAIRENHKALEESHAASIRNHHR